MGQQADRPDRGLGRDHLYFIVEDLAVRSEDLDAELLVRHERLLLGLAGVLAAAVLLGVAVLLRAAVLGAALLLGAAVLRAILSVVVRVVLLVLLGALTPSIPDDVVDRPLHEEGPLGQF